MKQTDFINFYGRRSSHLNENAKNFLKDHLDVYSINSSCFNDSKFIQKLSNYKKVVMEIGFGHGDFTHQYAIKNPDTFIIGVEIFQDGVLSLLRNIVNNEVTNISIYADNIYYLLDVIPDNFFDTIFILFPDPWPKKKHNKRRIINKLNLETFSRILKNGSKIRFVSDHYDYVSWSLEYFLSSKNWKLDNLDIDYFKQIPKDHFITKYQLKAKKEGRDISYFEFVNQK